MRSFIAMLLSASVSLQFGLVGPGCPLPHVQHASSIAEQPDAVVPGAMTGMEMPMPLDEPAALGNDNAASTSDEPSVPCEESGSQAFRHCMTPCSATLALATSVQSNDESHNATRELTTLVLEPPSPSVSPEPPPPRF